jgi:hypothetical protein
MFSTAPDVREGPPIGGPGAFAALDGRGNGLARQGHERVEL